MGERSSGRSSDFSRLGGRTTTKVVTTCPQCDTLTFSYAIVEIGLVEGDELIFKARAERNSAIPFESFRLKVGKEGITGWVAATGEPLLLPDVSQDPRYIQITDSVFRSELAVPIKTKEKVIGVLNVQSEQLNAFDESDLTVMHSTFAAH